MRSIISLLFDLFLVAVATAVAVLVRDNFEFTNIRPLAVAPYTGITIGVAVLVFSALGINRSLWRFTALRDYLRIVAATIMTVASAVAIDFLVNRLDGVARALPMIQAVLIVVLLVGARVAARGLHSGRRRQHPVSMSAGAADTVLLLGLNKLTELYLLCLAEFNSGRVRIAGLLDESGRTGLSVHSFPVLGTPEQIASALRYLEVRGVYVDCIVIAIPPHRLSPLTLAALKQIRESTTIRVEYLTERLGIRSVTENGNAPAVDSSGEHSVLGTVSMTPGQMSYDRIKRILDFTIALAMLVIAMPVVLLVGLLVAVDVGLPLIFWQQRPGLCGRPFKLYKFRTMADAHDNDGVRIPDGERVSSIGTFLRRTRLDELPQLFNILKGDMSFVGPRPLLPADQPGENGARLLVRPGLTGWAQIKGGREISAADKVALDVWYVRHMSFALDLEILIGTVPMILFGESVRETAIMQAWQDLQVPGVSESRIPNDAS